MITLFTRTIAIVLALAASAAGASAQSAAQPIDTTRETLERWVETRRVISKERRDWQLGREMLQERIALVTRETDSVQQRIAEVERNITEADRARTDLVTRNEVLKQAATALVAEVGRLESGTRELLARLPDPIRERVKPLSQRLPELGAETKLTLAERFQNVVGILNEINKFNRDITVASEVRPLPDGTSVAVTALYIGIGQGYYVTTNGQSAGIGFAAEKGWTWQPLDEAAPDIARAIAVVQGEQVPAFVRLPLQVK